MSITLSRAAFHMANHQTTKMTLNSVRMNWTRQPVRNPGFPAGGGVVSHPDPESIIMDVRIQNLRNRLEDKLKDSEAENRKISEELSELKEKVHTLTNLVKVQASCMDKQRSIIDEFFATHKLTKENDLQSFSDKLFGI